MAVAISFTVVLPQLPVMASTFGLMRSRTSRPRRPSPLRVSPPPVVEWPAAIRAPPAGTGAAGNRLVAEIVGVETLAAQGHEQRPAPQGTGVGADRRDLMVAPDQTGIEHLRQVGKPEGHHLNDSINVYKAAATVSRSL